VSNLDLSHWFILIKRCIVYYVELLYNIILCTRARINIILYPYSIIQYSITVYDIPGPKWRPI
jgi:hypothetical protein